MFACMAWSRRGETGERRRWRKQHVRNPLHREPSRCYHHDDNILIISWKRIKLSTFKRELISPTAIGYVHHFLRIFTNIFLKKYYLNLNQMEWVTCQSKQNLGFFLISKIIQSCCLTNLLHIKCWLVRENGTFLLILTS